MIEKLLICILIISAYFGCVYITSLVWYSGKHEADNKIYQRIKTLVKQAKGGK